MQIGQIAYDPSRGVPVCDIVSFIARIAVADDSEASASDMMVLKPLRLYTYGEIANCYVREVLETMDRQTGQLREKDSRRITPGKICRVRIVPVSSMYLEPYTDFPNLGKIILKLEVAMGVVAAGVVESVERKQ